VHGRAKKRTGADSLGILARTPNLLKSLVLGVISSSKVRTDAFRGYGCEHVLPALPTTVPCEKTVIGFSDATALFYALTADSRHPRDSRPDAQWSRDES
jgi:hypothetical protein